MLKAFCANSEAKQNEWVYFVYLVHQLLRPILLRSVYTHHNCTLMWNMATKSTTGHMLFINLQTNFKIL